MKVSEIKSGYLLKLRCGNYVGVYETDDCGISVSGEDDWFPLKCLEDDTLNYVGSGILFDDEPFNQYDIMEVWGRTHPRGACQFDTEDRGLLWERKEEVKEPKCECGCKGEEKPPVSAEEAAEATREIVDAFKAEGFSKEEAMAFLASIIVGGMAFGIGDKK